jgi:hypothetical protein
MTPALASANAKPADSRSGRRRRRPSPQAAVEAAERVVAELERKRQVLADKAAEYAKAREALAFRAHAQLDVEAGRELSEARDVALQSERELSEIDSAITTARTKLAEAQAAMARDERRAQIKEQQKRSREFREIGPFCDKHLDALRRGLEALSANAVHVAAIGGMFKVCTVVCRSRLPARRSRTSSACPTCPQSKPLPASPTSSEAGAIPTMPIWRANLKRSTGQQTNEAA